MGYRGFAACSAIVQSIIPADRLRRPLNFNAEQATDAVDGGGASDDVTLASAVDLEAELLIFGLDGDEAHVGPLEGFADGGGIGRVIFALLAARWASLPLDVARG